ncbi:RluA family pseudouridine synthase [Helicobacter sp. faydin-H76]|uniref:RNA pseudouridylate synthase n=2 Tax=Helicobacter cappadocius TaxID=3063998 RepID=A0AA90T503_9HELI|nr:MULTISPECIES: RluA family pseudouridine synthase [unclassified Helicobacter]MDO7252870.1 RluA family pseudouridine synthase [Helicobacter sp. faydin-H75]MDP2538913.1 RluA family pseudouridine synthase [Helicobacter sp. faydin-H76]
MNTLGCSQKQAQKHLDKNRLKQNNIPIHKSQTIIGKVSLTYFQPSSLNIEPIFITPYFAIYDKPPNLLVHPKGYFEHLSLCDDIKVRFGKEANPVHRLDYETSGLIMVSKNKKFEPELKSLFETKKISKTYLAFVEGEIEFPQTIDLPIFVPTKQSKFTDLGIKCQISKNGKPSITKIFPIYYDEQKNLTLLKIIPITGRTHQIRLHLSEIGHKIMGEPLYGVDNQNARNYLDKKFSTPSHRLMLHAQNLSFEYKNIFYHITSCMNFHATNCQNSKIQS